MFKTTIDGKEIKVTFQHQKAAHRGQLTRPEIRPTRLEDSENQGKVIRVPGCVRVPVFATCFCFFNDLCVGVAFCSYADEGRYSKEIGRRVSLKNALETALKRTGKNDHDVAEERAQVWEDYFRASKGKRAMNHPLVFGRALQKMAKRAEWLKLTGANEEAKEFLRDPNLGVGLLTDIPTPLPLDSDNTSIPWRLGGMSEETLSHLNELDAENN